MMVDEDTLRMLNIERQGRAVEHQIAAMGMPI